MQDCAIVPPAETVNASGVWDTFLPRINSPGSGIDGQIDDVHVVSYASPHADAFAQDLQPVASPALGPARTLRTKFAVH